MSLISPARVRGAEPSRAAGPASSGRLGWLDLLRGIAALTIAIGHYVQNMMPEAFTRIAARFDLGSFGVFLFFLVSGYIIPASLERRGSVREFWISRFFRIYPLCAAVVAAGVVVQLLGAYTSLPPIMPFPAHHPAVAALANLTMLHDFQGVGGAVFVMWTLSYEMVFYLLVASLFVLGLHRRSAEIAIGFSLVPVVAVSAFPVLLFSRTLDGTRAVVLGSAVLMLVGLACMVSGRRALAVVGALVLGGTAMVLVLTNSRLPGWYSMAVLATMFAGTAVYRAEQRQIGRAKVVVAAVVVMAALLYVGTWHGESSHTAPTFQWQWLTAMAATWGLFAAGMALRNRRIPRPFTWLGQISYSVYLVHAVLLCVLLWLVGPAGVASMSVPAKIGLGVVFCCAVAAVSHVTFRLVEQPAQRLGRRLSVRLVKPAAGPAAERA
ncbi:acyltransferase family protein [Streptomyces sp. NRRL B-24484]|uniref:acyltransferase family protein n=1 Tax=Streptomyces sp. NRRL B-24484 TaxID=1463833 RepID=UPI0006944C08|nr:acyltransferase [Streptomyces sp. NRRL B-24484]